MQLSLYGVGGGVSARDGGEVGDAYRADAAVPRPAAVDVRALTAAEPTPGTVKAFLAAIQNSAGPPGAAAPSGPGGNAMETDGPPAAGGDGGAGGGNSGP